jgi:hypothetical protein
MSEVPISPPDAKAKLAKFASAVEVFLPKAANVSEVALLVRNALERAARRRTRKRG